MNNKKNRPSKKRYTGKLKERLIVEGIHPMDMHKVTYAFIASNFLLTQVPLEGKVVIVDTSRGTRPLYVTGTHTWQMDEFVPERIAHNIYTGKKYRDVSIV